MPWFRRGAGRVIRTLPCLVWSFPMKVDFAKVYRNGITGRAIAEAMMAISAFTRGTARGGYGMWARRALQGAGLIAPKAFLSTIADFSAICRKVDSDAI